jgi:hypothetical protein
MFLNSQSGLSFYLNFTLTNTQRNRVYGFLFAVSKGRRHTLEAGAPKVAESLATPFNSLLVPIYLPETTVRIEYPRKWCQGPVESWERFDFENREQKGDGSEDGATRDSITVICLRRDQRLPVNTTTNA